VKKLAVLVALAGCNNIFDLRSTQQIDAAYFDAPLDAPFACPAIGAAPAFSSFLHQHVLQDCTGYAITQTGRAVASCRTAAGGPQGIYEGVVDEPLQPAAGLPPIQSEGFDGYDYPRPSPDGQRLLIRHVDYNTGNADLSYYQRAGNAWSALPPPPFAGHLAASTIAMGPTGYHVLVVESNFLAWTEWIDEGGLWRAGPTHSSTVFGLHEIDALSMTSDGLRAILLSRDPSQMFYADRSAIGDAFSAAQAMPTLPVNGDAFMTADCARVYLSGLGYVFYVQQQ
jgi:hypothetical protein